MSVPSAMATLLKTLLPGFDPEEVMQTILGFKETADTFGADLAIVKQQNDEILALLRAKADKEILL